MPLGGNIAEDGGGRARFGAAVGGLAALCGAALAVVGAMGGAPDGRPRGRALPPAAAGPAGDPALPVSLCFRGPRGEPVDAPAAPDNCSSTGAAGARQ